MPNAFPTGLEPAPLWERFDFIRSIPRCSGNEARLREALLDWARGKGLEAEADEAGNLLLRLPASPGLEHAPVVALQGHIDMVCEKNADKDFDFASQGIDVLLDGEWLTADGTTLGADNGIGVAAALALADDPDARHGPIEILLTVDEETGMTGAFGLQPGWLRARTLINVDTEEEFSVYVGCSGGGDTVATFTLERAPASGTAMELRVFGLQGGHSGLDIHLNRANAIKLLARLLDRGAEATALRIHAAEGGSKRNAIPREARAVVDVADPAAFRAAVEAETERLRAEYRAADPGLQVELRELPGDEAAGEPFTAEDSARLLRALLATPSGVLAMSRDVPGLVETSTNLGVLRTEGDRVELVDCSRSSVDAALEALRRSLRALYLLAGAEVVLEPAYPGWQPNLESPLLARAIAVHERMFGRKPEIKAVHAGLECGLLTEKFPGVDMISIGPDIRGAHSPDERVHVASVARFYSFLKALLAELAGA